MAENPFCLCLAGPNGSGKSTLTKGLRTRFSLQSWIDPDQLARNMAASYGHAQAGDDIVRKAFRAARKMRVDLAAGLEDFGFETVFSHGSNVAFLRALKELGYEVHLYFVCTEDPEINVTRVRNRVKLGGHHVEDATIRERYHRSLGFLALSLRDFDRVVLFDNSRAYEIVSNAIISGRTVAEFYSDRGGSHHEEISLYPPVPTWALKYAVFPSCNVWARTQLAQQLHQRFGAETHFVQHQGLKTQADRVEFLQQFIIDDV